MNCLLCNQTFGPHSLKQYYAEFHKIDSNNRFFKALFSENIVTSKSKKFRVCGKIVFTDTNQKKNFFETLRWRYAKYKWREAIKLYEFG